MLEEETFKDKSDHQHVESENSKDCSELADIFCHFLEFLLQRCLLVTFLHLSHNLAEARFFTDHESEESTLALGDRSARLQDGRRQFVLAHATDLLGFTCLPLRIFKTFNALGLSSLADLVRFASHGRFVSRDLGAGEDQTVNRDGHTIGDLHDVTDVEILRMD